MQNSAHHEHRASKIMLERTYVRGTVIAGVARGQQEGSQYTGEVALQGVIIVY
jgi:hypothetical protein